MPLEPFWRPLPEKIILHLTQDDFLLVPVKARNHCTGTDSLGEIIYPAALNLNSILSGL